MHILPRKNEVREVHVEATSRCNLTCPQCARSPSGVLNPKLPMSELSIEDIQRIFDPDFCKQLEQVYFNGNFGDPAASSCLPEALLWLKTHGVRKINFFTNGSLRNPEWWQRIAMILRPTDYVVFSIDGLEDTNHIYRRGANFSKIMENAETFIKHGGNARWDFLKFEHNIHQVDEARALAKSMGFKNFVAKDTVRFIDEKQSDMRKEQVIHLTKRRSNGNVIAMVDMDKISPTSDNKTMTRMEFINQKYGSFENYMNNNTIACKSTAPAAFNKRPNIFIDFTAKIWPCCWLGCVPHWEDDNYLPKHQYKQMIEKYGIEFNDTRVHSLEKILEHQWYTTDLPASWNNKIEDEVNPRLQVCGKTCGTDFEWSSGAGSKNATVYKL